MWSQEFLEARHRTQELIAVAIIGVAPRPNHILMSAKALDIEKGTAALIGHLKVLLHGMCQIRSTRYQPFSAAANLIRPEGFRLKKVDF
jgi:hypothetical protein